MAHIMPGHGATETHAGMIITRCLVRRPGADQTSIIGHSIACPPVTLTPASGYCDAHRVWFPLPAALMWSDGPRPPGRNNYTNKLVKIRSNKDLAPDPGLRYLLGNYVRIPSPK